ncbi:DUF2235 domain-containing protein [Nordella sp. HKS 07]|uniref:T6SS phospholipase effector Tle1-like catalytic domain-containing protein n=1 Tax=Nordella sp. HKS 07 TaxID=2712222 RepID=UPI0013E110CC|nr:DUF2235 domain-containing protein [Nordella sp. HKS 07]QIG50540.1 DUF2235 domain-containing protein [Nordella sp. HKS 07]
MAGERNLVVLADGTGNSAAKAFKTNVWRLYEALDLNGADQIAVFSDGVGTSSFKPFQVIGLALGFGVKRRVLALYRFLCLNYQPGDQIYAFGFSRGAFTIRVLVGLIHREGLVGFSSTEELDRNALAAYRAYREKAFPSGLPWIGALRKLRDTCVRWWNAAAGSRTYAEVRPTPGDPRAAGNVRIRFLGVWDTVAAYGLPIDELTRAVDRWVWPMSFKDKRLLASVDRARQAFSVDDERRTFFPIRWDPDSPSDLDSSAGTPPRLRQVWFTGAHSNVGGGYPDDRLAYLPLCWMIGEAAEGGLRFKSDIVADYWDEASESGRRYGSRSGLGVFYRYHPRDARELMQARPLVDASAIIRMARGSDSYGPIALPENIDVLTPYDEIVSLEQLGNVPAEAPPPTRPDKLPSPPGRARDLKEMQQSLYDAAHRLVAMRGADRPERVELMRDTVWWGRALYYVTLALFVLAALYPLIAGYLVNEKTVNIEDTLHGLIAPLAGLLQGVLPGFAAPWVQAIINSPAGAIVLALAIGICLWIGGFLRTRIHDRARAVWSSGGKADSSNSMTSRKRAQRRFFSIAAIVFLLASLAALVISTPRTTFAVVAACVLFALAVICLIRAIRLARAETVEAADQPPPALRFARRIRTNPAAISLYNALRVTWLPALFLVLASALIFFAVNKAAFEIADSMGQICPTPSPPAAGMTADFKTQSICTDTGIDLAEGVTYEVAITIPASDPWLDAENCADVLGVSSDLGWWRSSHYFLGALAKRWWTEPYFRPIARVGRFGGDEYALTPIKEPKERIACQSNTLRALMTAGKSGRLYLFVNDTVIGFPGLYANRYKKNHGLATASVCEIDPATGCNRTNPPMALSEDSP